MLRRTTILAVAAAALAALAMPSIAQAVPLVTNASEEAVEHFELDHSLTMAAFEWHKGSFFCETMNLTVVLTENAEELAQGHGSGTAQGNITNPHGEVPCEFAPGGVPIDFESITLENLSLAAGGSGNVDLAFTFLVTYPQPIGPIMCSFTGGAAITYEEGSDELHLEGNVFGNENLPLCPGGAELTGFDLTATEAGEPVTFG